MARTAGILSLFPLPPDDSAAAIIPSTCLRSLSRGTFSFPSRTCPSAENTAQAKPASSAMIFPDLSAEERVLRINLRSRKTAMGIMTKRIRNAILNSLQPRQNARLLLFHGISFRELQEAACGIVRGEIGKHRGVRSLSALKNLGDPFRECILVRLSDRMLQRAPEDRADPSGGPGYGQGLPEDQGLSYDHAEGLMP